MKAVLLVLGCLLATACAAERPGPERESDPVDQTALAACSGSLDEMNGRRCSNDGSFCSVPFECGSFLQQVRCFCTGGRFRCEDGTSVIPPGAAPRCSRSDPASDEPCPAAPARAQGAACTRVGQACFYVGLDCPERPIPHYDSCVCQRHDDVLTFECTIPKCIGF